MSVIRRALALALLLALAVPTAAYARVVEYQIQLSPAGDPAGALAVVNVVLDSADPLPQEVSIPVPHGATLLWAGEILGGAPEDDPAREPTLQQVGDMDVYTFTLEQTFVGQLEIALDAAEISGNELSYTMTWTNPGEEVLVTASVIAEAGASDVKVAPARAGDVQSNDIGETLHPLEGRRVATGEGYVIEASWTRGAAAVATQSGGADPGVLPYLIGALVIAVLLLVAVVVRERTRARARTDA
ncbi:MAG: hypothetical protein JW733_06035 [Coriobacteriia bacterium]|nr:hypothetical protein [Coriobacteriia bacterium]MBN2839562.1 hypothetical protein [Coriobacteriia bacterium]